MYIITFRNDIEDIWTLGTLDHYYFRYFTFGATKHIISSISTKNINYLSKLSNQEYHLNTYYH